MFNGGKISNATARVLLCFAFAEFDLVSKARLFVRRDMGYTVINLDDDDDGDAGNVCDLDDMQEL